MRLIETWLADPERAFDLFAKFPAEETGFENPAVGMDREQFAAYVRGLRDESLGVGLPDGWVPATKYILVNDEGDYVASSTCVTGSPTSCATVRATSATVSPANTAVTATRPPGSSSRLPRPASSASRRLT